MEKRKLEENPRVIVNYKGDSDGPLLIVIGALHGNEPVGVWAIQYLHKMLEVEPFTNPDFNFKGNFIGIIGNLKAYQLNERFINKDINRQWTPQHIDQIKILDFASLDAEDQEMIEVLDTIQEVIAEFKPKEMYILDVHTTSSDGGIFSIPAPSDESFRISKELHAPVVKGMTEGIGGTTLHYFNTQNFPIPTTAVTFEAGQHQDSKSVNRAIAAIINFMRTIQCVNSDDVENIHDQILMDYSKDLPKVTELILRYPVGPEDNFVMKPGYKNFQAVKKDEILASNEEGNILCPQDAFLLMPLYQKKGEDGFFLVKVLS